MKHTILFVMLGMIYAFGMDYHTFKTKALKHTMILKQQHLTLQAVQAKNSIALRTANPTLSFELSHYDAKGAERRLGYTTEISQSVRTGSYLDALRSKADATKRLAEALVTEGRAGYLKELEMLYTAYVYECKMLKLLEEEYKLSQKVTEMVKARYKGGSEKKVAYLRAKAQTLRLKTQRYATQQERTRRYHQLLAIAGLRKKVKLTQRFIYPVSAKIRIRHTPSPKEQILKAKIERYRSEYRINQSRLRNYELYAGAEREPEQSIFRVGVSLPLPLFNDRSEERALAKLKMAQTRLESQQLALDTKAQKQILRSSIRTLTAQYHALKALQKQQKELVALLQEGYEIAQGSLFELMGEKQNLIQTKKALIETDKMRNEAIIALHFLQGTYNE